MYHRYKGREGFCSNIYIPNAFIQTQIKHEKDMAIIKICRILVGMLLDIASDAYGMYVALSVRESSNWLPNVWIP